MSNVTRAMMMGAAGVASAGTQYIDDIFNTYMWEGNNSSKTLTTGIDLAGEGGMLWIKKRSGQQNHCIQDTEQGLNKYGLTNATSPFYNSSTRVTGSSEDGFTIGSDSDVNQSGDRYVGWSFRKALGFFDVVTWTGNSTAGRQIPHSLESVPGMILVKVTNQSDSWVVYHHSKGNQWYAKLDTTDAGWDGTTMWNNTTPTSTHFTIGDGYDINYTGNTYVAYIFAHDSAAAARYGQNYDESVISCGLYNGANGRNYVNIGFEPQFVLLKCVNGTNAAYRDWCIYDNQRPSMGFFNNDAQGLHPNDANGEFSSQMTFHPTGFYLNTGSSENNSSSHGYIYMAIRRTQRPVTSGSNIYETLTYTGDSSFRITSTNISPDMVLSTRTTSNNKYIMDRKRSLNYWLTTNTSDPQNQQTQGIIELGNNYMYTAGGGTINSGGESYVTHLFKRAKGFFDISWHYGNASATSHFHNLGVVPEMMIVKRMQNSSSWQVYHKTPGPTKYAPSFRTDPFYSSSNRWDNTTPTNQLYYLGNDNDVNAASEYFINYLFATLPGVSKVGSYSGYTGYDVNVDCGFTNGARFILIKRMDTEIQGTTPTDWYVWNSVSGISSGNDPFLTLNKYDAEVTNTDYIDPLSNGFTVTSNAHAGLNATGGTYIFLAIA